MVADTMNVGSKAGNFWGIIKSMKYFMILGIFIFLLFED